MTHTLLKVENLAAEIVGSGGVAQVVRGVDLTVDRGEIVGLVGESGSGKSLTVRALLGLLPSGGRITSGTLTWEVETADVATWGEADFQTIRGRRIATVFQDPMTALNPVVTVGRHLEQVLARHQGLRGAEAKAEASRLWVRVGLAAGVGTKYPHQLSGGMRQRVAIALALGCQPDLVIADEPTTALDVTIQAQILDLLADLCRRDGLSVLLITHDLGIVAQRCDRAMVMYGGRILAEGPVARLFEGAGHPYTRALIGALPTLDEDKGRRLDSIPGRPPSPRDPETGCPFAPRCPQVVPTCRTELAPLVDRLGQRHRCPVVGVSHE